MPHLRRLQDGRWTLAFADEASAVAAKRLLDSEAAALQHAARHSLAPLLRDPSRPPTPLGGF